MLPLYAGVYRELSPTQIGMLFTISGIIVIAMIVPAASSWTVSAENGALCQVQVSHLLVFILIPVTNNFIQLAS